jgi:hypothetical protein
LPLEKALGSKAQSINRDAPAISGFAFATGANMPGLRYVAGGTLREGKPSNE